MDLTNCIYVEKINGLGKVDWFLNCGIIQGFREGTAFLNRRHRRNNRKRSRRFQKYPHGQGKPEIEAGAFVHQVGGPRQLVLGYSIMTNFLKTFVADESGASAAEYALILIVIGIAIVAGATTLATSIGGAMTGTATCIDDPTVAGAC
ncbi:Flp family type IVb pilin [Erythrobacter mangrovi]|nr:Flp family type IVb pilin [Erythrobacter mangrovi]